MQELPPPGAGELMGRDLEGELMVSICTNTPDHLISLSPACPACVCFLLLSLSFQPAGSRALPLVKIIGGLEGAWGGGEGVRGEEAVIEAREGVKGEEECGEGVKGEEVEEEREKGEEEGEEEEESVEGEGEGEKGGEGVMKDAVEKREGPLLTPLLPLRPSSASDLDLD